MNSITQNSALETAYKHFQLGDIPIYKNMERISIKELFKLLTTTKLENLSTVELMNFYLYCNFFKNRLLYSDIFKENITYINSKFGDLMQRINDSLRSFEEMIKVVKSESDTEWISNNISILHDALTKLDAIQNRCDYYDAEVEKYLSDTPSNIFHLAGIQEKCAQEFTELSNLFSEVGRIIGRK